MKKDIIDECVDMLAIVKHSMESPNIRNKLFEECAKNITINNNLLKRLRG